MICNECLDKIKLVGFKMKEFNLSEKIRILEEHLEKKRKI